MSTKIETTDTSIRQRAGVSRKHNPSNEPGSCLWCGKRLRLKTHTTRERNGKWRKPGFVCHPEGWEATNETNRFSCKKCGGEALGEPVYATTERTPVFEGGARGDYGDNAFCGLRCGYAFGAAFARMGSRLKPPSEKT